MDPHDPASGDSERAAQEGRPGPPIDAETDAGDVGSVGSEAEAAPDVQAGAPSASDATRPWRGPEASGFEPDSLKPAADDPGETAGETTAEATGWRGPETTGWTPEKATPPPVADGGTESWRGPEPSGWAPGDPRLAAPEPQATIRTGEPGEATRDVEPSSDMAASDDAATADVEPLAGVEPAARERVPAGFSFFNRARPEDDDIEDDAAPDPVYARPSHLRVEERPRRLPGRRAASAPVVRADPAEICPFLVAASGGWRLAVPSREHRCGAVNPPSPLSPQKQTRLCLTEGHLRCATFLAAGAARESRVGSAAIPDRVSRWALARTTPVVEEVGGVRTTLAGMLADRRRWPAIPAMLLVIALATLGLSSLRGGGSVTALASPTLEPTELAAPTVSIAPTPSLAPTPEPTPSAAPTAPPTAAPTPAPSQATYTVQSGDTLSGIARQFGTTVQALVDLNSISDPASLKIGQVLLIP